MNDILRKKVKILHALQNIKYKDLAKRLGISEDGFYMWRKGLYNLGETKQIKLKEIVDELWLEEYDSI